MLHESVQNLIKHLFADWQNSLSAVLWLMSNLCSKSCESLWIKLEVMHLFAIGHFHCHTLFWLIGINANTHLHTHTHTHTLTHTWSPCQMSASCGENCGHHGVRNFCEPTQWPIELLVTANKGVLFRSLNYLITYSHVLQCFCTLFQHEWQWMGLKNAVWDLLK